MLFWDTNGVTPHIVTKLSLRFASCRSTSSPRGVPHPPPTSPPPSFSAVYLLIKCSPRTLRGCEWSSVVIFQHMRPNSWHVFFGQVRSDSAYMQSHQLTHFPFPSHPCPRFSFLRAGQTAGSSCSYLQVMVYFPACLTQLVYVHLYSSLCVFSQIPVLGLQRPECATSHGMAHVTCLRQCST